jgi:dolichol-phosphate mannosyltransferase
MDADYSHNPVFIPDLLRESAYADMVIGSRYIRGGADKERGIIRKIVSACARRYLRMMLGVAVADPTSGYRCFRREALVAIMSQSLRSRDPFIITEMLYRAHCLGLRIAEVPIIFAERRWGSSKLGPSVLIGYLWKVVKLRCVPSGKTVGDSGRR